MSADVVNLRQARKQKARADKDKQAAQNRATFGRPKADRERAAAEADRARKVFDAHKRSDDDAAT